MSIEQLAKLMYEAEVKYRASGGYAYPATYSDLSDWSKGLLIIHAKVAYEALARDSEGDKADSTIPQGAD